MNLTTRAEAARALSAHYMPELLATVDFSTNRGLAFSYVFDEIKPAGASMD